MINTSTSSSSSASQETTTHMNSSASHEARSSSGRTLIFSMALCVAILVALLHNVFLQAPVTIEDSAILTKKTLKTQLPIYDASLFKSGTTTAHQYFLCGGQRSVHHGFPYHLHQMVPSRFKKIGFFIRNNVWQSKKPFEDLGYDVFHDSGIQEGGDMCWHPSVHALEEIYQAYPNSTIMQITRSPKKWVRSLKNYKKGAVMRRVASCTCKNFPRDLYGKDLTDEDFANFYTQQVQRVRDFTASRSSLNYIEVSLEDPNIGQILEDRVGIDASCWGHANGTPNKYKWWYFAK